MSRFIIKRGDLSPGPETILKNHKGQPIDLSLATGVSVRLVLPDGTKFTGPATIETPAAGHVSYTWVAPNTDQVGEVLLEWVVDWTGKPSTYPSNSHNVITINESLA